MMFKFKYPLVLLLSASFLTLAGCDSKEEAQPDQTAQEAVTEMVNETVNPCDMAKSPDVVTATVSNIPLEGGFWGLESKDKQKYLPLNLEAAFLVEGAVLRFTYEEVTDRQSIQQWGTMIRITEVCSADIPENPQLPESPEL